MAKRKIENIHSENTNNEIGGWYIFETTYKGKSKLGDFSFIRNNKYLLTTEQAEFFKNDIKKVEE